PKSPTKRRRHTVCPRQVGTSRPKHGCTGAWCLVLLWSLVLGAWCFDPYQLHRKQRRTITRTPSPLHHEHAEQDHQAPDYRGEGDWLVQENDGGKQGDQRLDVK